MFYRTNEDLAIQKRIETFERAKAACAKFGCIRKPLPHPMYIDIEIGMVIYR